MYFNPFIDKVKVAIIALNLDLKNEVNPMDTNTRLIHLGFGPNVPGTVTHRLLGLLQKAVEKE